MLICVSAFGQRSQMSHSELVEFLNTNVNSKVWIVDSVLFFDHSKMTLKPVDSTDPLPRHYVGHGVKKQQGQLFHKEAVRDEILLENDSIVVIRRRKIPASKQLLAMKGQDSVDHRFELTQIDLRKRVMVFANATTNGKKRIQFRPTEEASGQIHTLVFDAPDSKKIASAIFTLKRYQQIKRKK